MNSTSSGGNFTPTPSDTAIPPQTPPPANGEEKQKPAYYAIIPAHVRYDEGLPPNAKLLYGEITALCNMEGFCWAGNPYFAKLYGVKVRAVQRWIEALAEAGHILVEPIDGYKRHIRLPEAERAARVKKDMGACQKRHTPMSKMTRPRVKKDTHNTTESITKKNTKNSAASPPGVFASLSPEEQQRWDALGRAEMRAKGVKAPGPRSVRSVAEHLWRKADKDTV